MSTLLGEESIHALQQDIEEDDSTVLPSPSSVTPPTTNPLIENNNAEAPENYRLAEEEIQSLRESESRYKQQYLEAQKREKVLIRRLATKEQEMQEYVNQNAELKASQAPSMAALRSVLLDPAVNILFQKLKNELQATKARLEDTQNELSAWKFTPDSNTGKRLMAKCRLLYQENEELGKMTSNGRLAKLEGDLALQKSFSEEVKKSQSELDDFLQELDEDVEGMQSTILFLQQELKLAKETITNLERENFILKNGNGPSSSNNGHDICDQENDSRNSDKCDNYLNGTRNVIESMDATTTSSPSSQIEQIEQRTTRSKNRNGTAAAPEIKSYNENDDSSDDDDDDDDDDLTTSSDDQETAYTKPTANSKNGDNKSQKRTTSAITGHAGKKVRRTSALSIDLSVTDATTDLH